MTFRDVDPFLLPSVYWFWHSIPTDEEIERQISEMDRSGIRTFLIQARLAFPRADYLSEKYFAAYEKAVVKAKSLGMTVGIYDDYNWDSGQAGGRTVELDATARETHLFWTTGSIREGRAVCTISDIHSSMYTGMGAPVMEWIYEGGKPCWDHWKVFSALAFRGNTRVMPENVIDVTGLCSIERDSDTGCKFELNIQDHPELEGFRVVIFANAQCVTSRLINYLSPSAVESFLQAGYEPYRKHLSKYFGDPIKYAFFDHPYGGFYDWQERSGNLGNSLMFDPRFVEAFSSQKGYSLEIALLSFLEDLGSQTPKLRCDLFEVYGAVGRENFFGKLAAWTKQNGIGLSGHELLAHVGAWGYTQGFAFLDPRTNFACDYFAIDAYRTQTAVDACNYVPQVSAKIGDSVAKANGRRGCLIEQYAVATDTNVPGGAGYWGLTLTELRAQAIRHTFMGASQFIFHGYYQTDGSRGNASIYSNPRFDFAPGLNFEPWFKQYPVFAREMGQLNSLINTSKPSARVAVLYPMRTWWTEGGDHPFSGDSEKWFRFLVENNIPFDLISEEQLGSAKIEAGLLKIGKEMYQALIFGAVSIIGFPSVLNIVERFVQEGGLFIASTLLPSATQMTGESPLVSKGFSRLCNENPGAIFLPEFSPEAVSKFFHEKGIKPDFKLTSGNNGSLHCWVGEISGDPLYVFFNDQVGGDRLVFKCPGQGMHPYSVDLKNGSEQPWVWMQNDPTGTRYFKDMQAGELCAVRFKRGRQPDLGLIECDCRVECIQFLDGRGINVTLDTGSNSNFTAGVKSKKPPRISTGGSGKVIVNPEGNSLWSIHGERLLSCKKIELTNWTFSIEQAEKEQPIDIQCGWETQGFGDFKGEGVYRTHFDLERLDEIPCQLKFARVETTCEVLLNGKTLGVLPWAPYTIEVPTDYLQVRVNELVVKVSNTAANYYYDDTPFQPSGRLPSGLIGAPIIDFTHKVEILLEG